MEWWGDRTPSAEPQVRPVSVEEGWAAGPSEDWLGRGNCVHLRIWLGGMVFDYAVTAVAARNIFHDWRRRRWFTIELIRDTIEECRLLPRLPCEQLFAGP